jgi:hypothetical protein
MDNTGVTTISPRSDNGGQTKKAKPAPLKSSGSSSSFNSDSGMSSFSSGLEENIQDTMRRNLVEEIQMSGFSNALVVTVVDDGKTVGFGNQEDLLNFMMYIVDEVRKLRKREISDRLEFARMHDCRLVLEAKNEELQSLVQSLKQSLQNLSLARVSSSAKADPHADQTGNLSPHHENLQNKVLYTPTLTETIITGVPLQDKEGSALVSVILSIHEDDHPVNCLVNDSRDTPSVQHPQTIPDLSHVPASAQDNSINHIKGTYHDKTPEATPRSKTPKLTPQSKAVEISTLSKTDETTPHSKKTEASTVSKPIEVPRQSVTTEVSRRSKTIDVIPQNGEIGLNLQSKDTEVSPQSKGTEVSPQSKGTEVSPQSKDTEVSPQSKDTEVSPQSKDTEVSPQSKTIGATSKTQEYPGVAREDITAKGMDVHCPRKGMREPGGNTSTGTGGTKIHIPCLNLERVVVNETVPNGINKQSDDNVRAKTLPQPEVPKKAGTEDQRGYRITDVSSKLEKRGTKVTARNTIARTTGNGQRGSEEPVQTARVRVVTKGRITTALRSRRSSAVSWTRTQNNSARRDVSRASLSYIATESRIPRALVSGASNGQYIMGNNRSSSVQAIRTFRSIKK